jgi:putative oxidoreductase
MRISTPLDRLYNPDVGLLILRIVLGIVFMGHGAQKLFGMFGGPGIGGITGYFGSLGVPMPAVMAWVVGLFEFLGGLYVLIGFLTPVGGIMITCVMLGAIFLVHLSKGFWNGNGGMEFPLMNIAAALALTFAGPGRYSVEGASSDVVVRTRPVTTV